MALAVEPNSSVSFNDTADIIPEPSPGSDHSAASPKPKRTRRRRNQPHLGPTAGAAGRGGRLFPAPHRLSAPQLLPDPNLHASGALRVCCARACVCVCVLSRLLNSVVHAIACGRRPAGESVGVGQRRGLRCRLDAVLGLQPLPFTGEVARSATPCPPLQRAPAETLTAGTVCALSVVGGRLAGLAGFGPHAARCARHGPPTRRFLRETAGEGGPLSA